MATNLFSKAAAYRKKHPGMTMPDAIKILSGKKPAKKAPVKKTVKRVSGTPKKKAAVAKKVVIRVNKKGGVKATIGSVSLSKIAAEHSHQAKLSNQIDSLNLKMKVKGILASERAAMARDVKKIKAALAASKTYINQLKKAL